MQKRPLYSFWKYVSRRSRRISSAALTALLFGASNISLRAASFSDDNWISMGGSPGAQGPVHATVVDASGNLYIGGGFGIVGDVSANGVAKWDGTNWSALGSGLNGGVYALAVSGHDLYAAGRFTTAGGVAANSIAKWNGTNWSALGSGIVGGPWGPYVYALATSGSDLYVGGSFATAGGNPATNIAKWNGSSWSALGSGMDNIVSALAVSGNNVYAGGYFTNAGGVMANRLAKWNGSSWSALGSGMNSRVSALAVSGSDLYAGGDFTTAGGIAATNMARWNGSSWSAFPSPISSVKQPTVWGSVNDLTISGNDLYAAGDIEFDLGGGASTYGTYVMKWNGSSWSPLEPGIDWAWDPYDDPHVNALSVSGTNVYAGGEFLRAGNSTAYCIAKWNGTNWSAIAPTYRYLTAVTASGRDVYGAGIFTAADGAQSIDVAKWNTTHWSVLGSAFQNDNSYGPVVPALAVSGGDLYAGGSFTNAGGTPVNRIARWNGISWSPLGSGVSGSVSALAASGTNLYAAGSFPTAGGVAANGIAKWNGNSWSALGSGVGGVWALAISGNDLYAGGYFTSAGGVPANYIAKWNGTSWSALGSGMGGSGSASGYVTALAVMGSDLYAGGWFTTAGGITVRCVAKWNGNSWSALCSGMDADNWTRDGEHNTTPYVYALAVSGNHLYVGGDFNTAGDANADFIAKWNGSSWSTLGSGMEYHVHLLTASSDELFVAGGFTSAGGKLSPYLARARIGTIAQSVVRTNSTATIGFSGVTGYDYDVQRAASLNPPITWTTVTVDTLSPLPDGSFTFTDTNAAGAAYYRASVRPTPASELGVQQPVGTALINGVSSVAFGAVAVGDSAAKTFTITNSGTAPLTIFYVDVWGDFVADATGMLTNLPAGGSTTFTVTFSPGAAGSRTVAMDVQTDAVVNGCESSEGTFVIFLTGTGL